MTSTQPANSSTVAHARANASTTAAANAAITGAVLVTGANGHLGRKLLDVLASTRPVLAVVRSERARAALPAHANLRTLVLDYTDACALEQALQGCTAAVHLVGIIKESRANGFEQAHEATCTALATAAAAAGIGRIVYPSIVGARPGAANACLASKGRAEEILLRGRVPALVLRLPMVLGEDDYASRALARRARARLAFTVRAASLEQPIYAGDVIAAIVAGLAMPLPASLALDLGGPESLDRRALTQRAARVLGLPGPTLVSLPRALGMGIATALEALSANPPVTRAMLGVLDHDDAVDPLPAAARLGIPLTDLDTMLRHCIAAR